MKTITILLISLLNFSSFNGFADTLESNGNCCPAPSNMHAVAQQNQQVLLDLLQHESENLILTEVGLQHAQVISKVVLRGEERAIMNSIQLETENIPAVPRYDIAEKVKAHFNNTSTGALK